MSAGGNMNLSAESQDDPRTLATNALAQVLSPQDNDPLLLFNRGLDNALLASDNKEELDRVLRIVVDVRQNLWAFAYYLFSPITTSDIRFWSFRRDEDFGPNVVGALLKASGVLVENGQYAKWSSVTQERLENTPRTNEAWRATFRRQPDELVAMMREQPAFKVAEAEAVRAKQRWTPPPLDSSGKPVSRP